MRLLLLFGRLLRVTKKPSSVFGIPVVKFDQSNITEAVRHDVKRGIDQAFPALKRKTRNDIFRVALLSIYRGRDIGSLFAYLQSSNIEKRKAEEVSRRIHARASSLIAKEQQLAMGLSEAIWVHSGAPCGGSPDEIRAHELAGGAVYSVREGLLINGKRTWPGMDADCKCVSRSIVKGFT